MTGSISVVPGIARVIIVAVFSCAYPLTGSIPAIPSAEAVFRNSLRVCLLNMGQFPLR
jgi:hypothetical protein